MSYRVNEIFYSLQGEGVRAGTPNVFVRFSGCNLRCNVVEHGFDCDTEFASGVVMEGTELLADCEAAGHGCHNVIFTGGEPALQLDAALLSLFREAGWYVAIETNGTRELPEGIDWICVSPKTAEHTLHVRVANEVKYVRSKSQGLPRPEVKADHYLISPAFQPSGTVLVKDIRWCVEMVKANPTWSLSAQLHKLWNVR